MYFKSMIKTRETVKIKFKLQLPSDLSVLHYKYNVFIHCSYNNLLLQIVSGAAL
jgi:hypothetical protein